MSELVLRPATRADARLLFGWANDPSTRAASFSSAPIPWETHVAWLDRRLADPECRLWIGEADRWAVGTVRVERRHGDIEISVTIAPDARGRGLAAPLIRLGTSSWLADHPGPVLAYIKPGNAASIRAFSSAGYAACDSHREGALCFVARSA
jgi:RimJ/RimL family protein N-acetyltransferase